MSYMLIMAGHWSLWMYRTSEVEEVPLGNCLRVVAFFFLILIEKSEWRAVPLAIYRSSMTGRRKKVKFPQTRGLDQIIATGVKCFGTAIMVPQIWHHWFDIDLLDIRHFNVSLSFSLLLTHSFYLHLYISACKCMCMWGVHTSSTKSNVTKTDWISSQPCQIIRIQIAAPNHLIPLQQSGLL